MGRACPIRQALHARGNVKRRGCWASQQQQQQRQRQQRQRQERQRRPSVAWECDIIPRSVPAQEFLRRHSPWIFLVSSSLSSMESCRYSISRAHCRRDNNRRFGTARNNSVCHVFFNFPIARVHALLLAAATAAVAAATHACVACRRLCARQQPAHPPACLPACLPCFACLLASCAFRAARRLGPSAD